ncbi:unnamed protein product [Arctogadus glacialis]
MITREGIQGFLSTLPHLITMLSLFWCVAARPSPLTAARLLTSQRLLTVHHTNVPFLTNDLTRKRLLVIVILCLPIVAAIALLTTSGRRDPSRGLANEGISFPDLWGSG